MPIKTKNQNSKKLKYENKIETTLLVHKKSEAGEQLKKRIVLINNLWVGDLGQANCFISTTRQVASWWMGQIGWQIKNKKALGFEKIIEIALWIIFFVIAYFAIRFIVLKLSS